MTNVFSVQGGAKPPSTYLSATDGHSIVGSGSGSNPLRAKSFVYDALNVSGVNLKRCTPVKPVTTTDNPQIDRLAADGSQFGGLVVGNTNGIAVGTNGIAVGGSGIVQASGFFDAKTTEWDAVTGLTGGLTPGSFYYLNHLSPGTITATPPTTGQFVTLIGLAFTPSLILLAGIVPTTVAP